MGVKYAPSQSLKLFYVAQGMLSNTKESYGVTLVAAINMKFFHSYTLLLLHSHLQVSKDKQKVWSFQMTPIHMKFLLIIQNYKI